MTFDAFTQAVVVTSQKAAKQARMTQCAEQIPPKKACLRDRLQKGANTWMEFFGTLADSLPKLPHPYSKKALFVVSLSGSEGDTICGLLQSSLKKPFPMGFLYVDHREQHKTLAATRCLKMVKDSIERKVLKIPGYCPGGSVMEKLDIEKEAAGQAQNFKILGLNPQGRLVVPSDVHANASTLAVMSELERIRGEAKKISLVPEKEEVQSANVKDPKSVGASFKIYGSMAAAESAGLRKVRTWEIGGNGSLVLVLFEGKLALLNASTETQTFGKTMSFGCSELFPVKKRFGQAESSLLYISVSIESARLSLKPST